MTQRLSDMLVLGDFLLGVSGTASASTTTSATGSAVDAKDNHQAVVLAYAVRKAKSTTTATTGKTATTTASATVTLSATVQASTSTGFATPTTVISTTTKVSTSSIAKMTKARTSGTKTYATVTATAPVEVNVRGEAVQSQRAAEDRYIRAKVKIASAANGSANLYLDQGRNKPD